MSMDPFDLLFRQQGRPSRFDPSRDPNWTPQEGSIGYGQISPYGFLEPGSVDNAQLVDNAITSTKITDGSISTPKLAANSVTAANILAGAVTADKLLIGAARPYLTNPGFETGDLTGWTFAQTGTGGSLTVGSDPLWRSEGAYYGLITPGTSTTDASQIIPTGFRYGDKVMVSLLMANGNSTYIAVEWRDGSGAVLGAWISPTFASGTSGYGAAGPTRYSFITTAAPVGTVGIRLIVRATGGSTALLFDDVIVSRAGDLITPDGNVVINSSGITISNGKLTFADQFGNTQMDGGGFGRNWVNFIVSRIYNGDFTRGLGTNIPVSEVGSGSTVADYAASLSPNLPYWVVSQNGGDQLMQIADANASGGQAIQLGNLVHVAASVTQRIYQDIPVIPGENASLRRTWRFTFGSGGSTAVNIYTSFRDSNHALIGTRFGAGLSLSATSGYGQQTDVGLGSTGTPIIPTNAYYLRYEIETVFDPNTTAYLIVGDVAYHGTATKVYDLNSSAALTLTTAAQDVPSLSTTMQPGQRYLFIWTMDVEITATDPGYCVSQLVVGGLVFTNPQAIYRVTSAGRSAITQHLVTTTGSNALVKVQAYKTLAGGTAVVYDQHSSLTAIPI